MKKLNDVQQKNIIGGLYTYSQVCSGTHRTNKRRHDTRVAGSGSTARASRIAYNSELARHKSSNAMIGMSHNRYPVSV